jgi:RNA polymerase sigma-70 factor (ECF subfamily)
MDTLERECVDRARAGDRAAFDLLVTRYERQIYSFAYRLMGDADDAQDVAQDTFVNAYRAIGRIRGPLNLSAWLHRIASNRGLDLLRRRQRLRWLPWAGPKHDHLRPCAPTDEPERSALSRETGVAVQRVLNRLAPRHRLVLLLREYEGLTCAEIGEVMGLSRAAVKSLLYRARCEFRQVYLAAEAAAAGRAGAARGGGAP